MWYLYKHVPYYLVNHGNLIKILYTMVQIISILFDAEHPTVIPMYTPTTLQTPRGHMTRPLTYAIGHKVNPFLNASPFHLCETWLLPNARTLRMPRYQGDPLGDARNDVQVPKYKDEGARREEPEKGYRPRTSGHSHKPGHPAPARKSGTHHRTSRSWISPARTSGVLGKPRHPACRPDIRPLLPACSVSGPKAHVPLCPLDYIYSPPPTF